MASVGRKLTVDEFLDQYEAVPGKHELIGGVPVNMAGSSRLHYIVARNTEREIARQLVGGPCQTFLDPGIAAEDSVLYPDVAVLCDPRDFTNLETERRFYFPSFVVEVLSPSTRSYDLNAKLQLYKAIPSLRGILFIDPTTEVFLWHLRTPGGWVEDFVPPPEELDLTAFGFALARAEMFAR